MIRPPISPAAALALDATIITNKREIPSGKFFTGLFETALQPDEIIVQVCLPIPIKADTRSFPTPLHVSPWSVCSCRRTVRACASR